MSRIMYDSVNVMALPDDGDLYAGYVAGTYANVGALRERFPDKRIVTIATNAKWDADVLDVEFRAATPAQAPAWVVRQRERGADPTVYCIQLSGWAVVRDEFRRQGIPEPHYWVARYDGKAVVPDGAVAKQFRNPLTSGGHYDVSIVADYWPGIDQEDDMDPDTKRKIDELHEAMFVGYPEFGVPPIHLGVAAANFNLAGIDLPDKPSLIKRIVAKLNA